MFSSCKQYIKKFIYQKHTKVNMEICLLSLPLPGPAEPWTSDSSKSACLSRACMEGLRGEALLIVFYE